jgi:hypothetical protein
MRSLIVAVLSAISVILGAERPAAWGLDVHRLITDRAIDLLPDAIRPFFQKHRAFIVERSVDPDLWRNAGWTDETPRHFVDMDAYGRPPFTDLPREYDRAVERYGADFVHRNGTLPWRTSEIFGQLRRNFELQKKGVPGYALENIKFYSAVVAHYVEDGHVPLHAVLNYDGQLTGQHGIHSRWESELVMRNVKDLRLSPPRLAAVTDTRTYMFDVLQASFPHAEKILQADKLASSGRERYDDEYFRILDRETRPILEQRLSAAIAGVASVIAGAWEAGGRPALPLDPPKEARPIRRQGNY